MPDTHQHIPTVAERIHDSYPVDELPPSLNLALSNTPNTMARIELGEFDLTKKHSPRHPLGRTALEVTIIDHSGIPETMEQSQKSTKITLALGERAILGREQSHGLPLLETESVSANHLTLALVKDSEGELHLELHDNESTNGSRILLAADEETHTWDDDVNDTAEATEEVSHPPAQKDSSDPYEWVYDGHKRFPAIEHEALSADKSKEKSPAK